MLPNELLENLDCMFEDDLARHMELLVSVKDDYQGEDRATLEKLFGYAQFKLRAMRARLNGDVDWALAGERLADAVYKRLPEYARW